MELLLTSKAHEAKTRRGGGWRKRRLGKPRASEGRLRAKASCVHNMRPEHRLGIETTVHSAGRVRLGMETTLHGAGRVRLGMETTVHSTGSQAGHRDHPPRCWQNDERARHTHTHTHAHLPLERPRLRRDTAAGKSQAGSWPGLSPELSQAGSESSREGGVITAVQEAWTRSQEASPT